MSLWGVTSQYVSFEHTSEAHLVLERAPRFQEYRVHIGLPQCTLENFHGLPQCTPAQHKSWIFTETVILRSTEQDEK